MKNRVSLFVMAMCVVTMSASAVTQNDTVATKVVPISNQSRNISGNVSDRRGQPIIGATVKVKENAKLGTVTDVDGNFVITAVPDTCTLMFS